MIFYLQNNVNVKLFYINFYTNKTNKTFTIVNSLLLNKFLKTKVLDV